MGAISRTKGTAWRAPRAQPFDHLNLNIASGELVRYRIVGPDETDAQRGWISIDAPLARAMLKKRVDDEFEAMLPAGAVRFAIVEVSYAG